MSGALEKFWGIKLKDLQLEKGQKVIIFVDANSMDRGAGTSAQAAWKGTVGYGEAFDKASQEYKRFNFQLPAGFDSSQNVTLKAYWVRPNTTGGTIAWDFQYTRITKDAAADTGSTMAATAKIGSGGVAALEVTDLGSITSGLSPYDVVGGVIRRVVGVTGSYDADVVLVGFGAEVHINRLGSL